MNRENDTPWEYKPDGEAEPDSEPSDNEQPDAVRTTRHKTIEWESTEFIEHDHNAGWYFILAIATIGLAVIVYYLSKDKIATGTIVIVGAIVGIFANQKPGKAKYMINHSGLSINGKLYKYGNFKSFAIIRDGHLASINLFPLKRFLPPVSAYFEPKDEKKIMEVLGERLPYEDRDLDSIDRLSRRLRL